METEHPDYPIVDCVTQAEILVNKGVTVYQKFTCDHCGSRQTMEEPNKFYLLGKCEECGEETDIGKKGCNYVAHATDEAAQLALFEFMHGGSDETPERS